MEINSMLFSLSASILAGALLVPLLRKTRTTQTVLHYVSEHDSKNGTPTMGGLIFIFAISAFAVIYKLERLSQMCLIFAVGSGFVGLLDDFAKVKFGKNMGLRPYQKVVSQLLLAVFFSYFIYSNIGGAVSIPLFAVQIDIGFWIVPILIVAFIGAVNTVNLTDGLDGLCSSSVIATLISFAILLAFQYNSQNHSVASYTEMENLYKLIFSAVFAIFGFLLFNTSKASVFMGDVGSLFLGGFVVSVFAVSKNILYLPILGLPFVVSGLSDILQVGYFKLTNGKRIFLMAPFHHHLQRKGYSESKICVIYAVTTVLVSLVVISFVG